MAHRVRRFGRYNLPASRRTTVPKELRAQSSDGISLGSLKVTLRDQIRQDRITNEKLLAAVSYFRNREISSYLHTGIFAQCYLMMNDNRIESYEDLKRAIDTGIFSDSNIEPYITDFLRRYNATSSTPLWLTGAINPLIELKHLFIRYSMLILDSMLIYNGSLNPMAVLSVDDAQDIEDQDYLFEDQQIPGLEDTEDEQDYSDSEELENIEQYIGDEELVETGEFNTQIFNP